MYNAWRCSLIHICYKRLFKLHFHMITMYVPIWLLTIIWIFNLLVKASLLIFKCLSEQWPVWSSDGRAKLHQSRISSNWPAGSPGEGYCKRHGVFSCSRFHRDQAVCSVPESPFFWWCRPMQRDAAAPLLCSFVSDWNRLQTFCVGI